MTTTSPPADRAPADAPVRAPGFLARWAGTILRALVYSIPAFVLGLLGFVVTLVLLAVGTGTAVIWIGLPLLVAGVSVARGFAEAERGLQRVLLGRALPRPERRRAGPDAGRFRRLLVPLTDPQSWLDCLWTLVHFVLAVVTFPIMLASVIGSVATVAGPLASIIVRLAQPDADITGLGELLGLEDASAIGLDLGLQVLAGLIFLLTVHPVSRAVIGVHHAVDHALLSSRFDEQQQLARTEESRAAGRVAESESLRRLERDLHDGPQQGIVRATMDLARAERMADGDPERAQQILRETRTLLGSTLEDLRRLSRGIAPPILVDRGLAAALAERAALCPVPTSVDCPDLDLPEHVQIGIYYVVSEALANAAKHSQARTVQVRVTREAGSARAVIADDGRGGANIAAGHGLAGLAGRVASLEGSLHVDSPAGDGTRIEAVIPCAS
ncbi:histidine kinase [Brachybacterium endophyticum]|uniref:histidine kinase n=1 Tax=Brachybacterium endophyticum TaxID=2182385 RepID=A0A2U2RLB1_9MICO|nr:sensor histidine kinase [Brachybacterium endophyticum]PWH06626.1 histidine kinase [Brachybacterium endophyticum]